MNAREFNFDGLVGPTHFYGGLSYGNIASISHRAQIANPREAALQGLAKAKALADLGLGQGILAPQFRPDVQTLRALGFAGDDAAVLSRAYKEGPRLLAACSSASAMWTANAATVSPSADSKDGRVHFTAANLCEKFHRSIEHLTTTRILRAMFKNDEHFSHHAALPSTYMLGDEGAANHTRLCTEYGARGLQFFVYGRTALAPGPQPQKFPARQTLEASEAVARLHRIENVVYGQQAPDCIDGGAFHNDVVCVGNRDTLFHHEAAFLDSKKLIGELRQRFQTSCGAELKVIEVPTDEVSLEDAVKSYLFNSQLITLPSGKMVLVAPKECDEVPSVKAYLAQATFAEIKTFDLRQSMRNGGGPACLRLRVVLNEREERASNPKVLLTDELYKKLKTWVEKHYRDRLEASDLADPKLLIESQAACDELTQIMDLGSVYSFQI